MIRWVIALLLLLSCCHARATSYFLSPSGSDSNNGLSIGAAWLSPNHAVNCGDTLTATPGAYLGSNFTAGNWGTVSCLANNNVAWVICATFDGCKISGTSNASPGIWIDHSYWGVQGWEVTNVSAANESGCFTIAPNYTTIVEIHHIILANNVANGCQGGGFTTFNGSSSASVDYVILIGNIAYNAAQSSNECYSGISIFQPMNQDASAGTHIYIAGNFSYQNMNPSTCASAAPTDGEGVILDTFDNTYSGGPIYTGQTLVDNNVVFGNGGRGVFINNNNQSTFATVYFRHNTAYGNNDQTNQQYCTVLGELMTSDADGVTMTGNLGQTNGQYACSGDAKYAVSINNSAATTVVSSNWFYSATTGQATFQYGNGAFAFGSNSTSTSAAFSSPTVSYGAPACSGKTNTVNCMATVISDFAATASGAAAYGYQAASGTSITDALFPQWLCSTTNIPSGLVTMGCGVVLPSASGSYLSSGSAASAGVILR